MSKLLEEFATYAQSLKVAIDGGSPVGGDLSYDPDFESLKSEIDKLTSMTGEQPNWSEIAVMGEELLRDRSKDLRLLVWCTVARLRTRGLKGFGEGLAAATEVCRGFWEPMYPPVKRARARGNLAGWLSDQAVSHLSGIELGGADRETLQAVEHLCRELDSFLSEKLGQDHPGLGALTSVLRDHQRRLPPPAQAAPPAASAAPPTAAPPTAAPPTASAAASPAAPRAAAPPAPAASASPTDGPAIAVAAPRVTGSADVLPALRSLGKSVCECAAQLRKDDPAAAWAYRLQRTGLWLAVKTPPPAEGGKTRIAPPQAPQVKKLEALVAGEQWLELLNTAEGLTSTYLFWFDLHRWAVLAMDRLGALFVDARQTVVSELISFLGRSPGVVELCFADGTPFADAGTKGWIEEQQALLQGASSGGAASRVDEEEAELLARFEEAKDLAQSGKIAEAMSLGVQLAERGADLRSRFRSRLLVAQMALQGSKPEVARGMLEGLLEVAAEHALHRWEPHLCAQLYALLLAARRAAPTEQQRVSDQDLFDVLCRLDPAAALKVTAR